MSRFTVRSVALSGMLVAALFAVSQSSEARSAQVQPERESAEGCPLGKVAATPQCNYLAKCCAGNTENARKCCAGYTKLCGGN